MTEEAVVICMLVADLPVPSVAAQQMLCTECQEPVWVAQSSPGWARIVCTACAPKTVTDESYSTVTALQRADMHAAGFSDKEIEDTMKAADRWLGLR